MADFLKGLKDKAQTAINQSPLGAYVPGGQSPGASGGRSHALDTIQHQFRSLQLQYGSGGGKDVRQLQLIITGQKGIILDLDKEGMDAQAVSKELYLWGQTEDGDIKDVTDRLAYLTFVQGSLAQSLASSLDSARAPLKALRDAEAEMQPKRTARSNYEMQISKLRNEGKPGTDAKIRELEGTLNKLVRQDEPHEREIELLKRKAIIESERIKWEAVREYGEKLVLLSQASTPLLEALPSIPPSLQHPYTGAASTASTRALLQKALDTYKPGTTTLPVPTSADHEVRSFGETHASELSRIASVADRNRTPMPRRDSNASTTSTLIAPPPITHHDHDSVASGVSGVSAASGVSQATAPTSAPTPVDPTVLNNAPAPIPTPEPTALNAPAPDPQIAVVTGAGSGAVPTSLPTVAETGVPITAGADGPGPSHGSLASPSRGPGYGEATPAYGGAGIPKFGLSEGGVAAVKHESAEEEKARLAKEERERLLRGEIQGHGAQAQAGSSSAGAAAAGGSGSASLYETAEEEKARLAREDRERVLAGEASAAQVHESAAAAQYPTRQNTVDDTELQGDGTAPPPYEEPR